MKSAGTDAYSEPLGPADQSALKYSAGRVGIVAGMRAAELFPESANGILRTITLGSDQDYGSDNRSPCGDDH